MKRTFFYCTIFAAVLILQGCAAAETINWSTVCSGCSAAWSIVSGYFTAADSKKETATTETGDATK